MAPSVIERAQGNPIPKISDQDLINKYKSRK